jgi:hypothetical protein
MQEIAAMKLAIGEPVIDATPAPTQASPPTTTTPDNHDHMDMPMHMSHPMK